MVGIRADGSRDRRYSNLSRETAHHVRDAVIVSRIYSRVVIEDQKPGKEEPRC
jgi:hypothetical protein